MMNSLIVYSVEQKKLRNDQRQISNQSNVLVSCSSGKCCTGYKPSETLAHKPVFPFIDHVMSEMERRFSDDLKNHMTGYYLIPKNLRNSTPDATESLSVAFDADMPCQGNFRWKLKGGDLKMCDHPVHQNIPGLKYALKLADEDLYPNIHTICKLLIVFPVMYVCCKRSFSALRRHKTRVRSTMTGEYLCAEQSSNLTETWLCIGKTF